MPAAFIWPIKVDDRETAGGQLAIVFRVLRGVKLIPDEGMSRTKEVSQPHSCNLSWSEGGFDSKFSHMLALTICFHSQPSINAEKLRSETSHIDPRRL
ncbi:hypothetical protein Baya_12514 [Bagarius yarrelli]|uniref:Uncharacterized protein n=1 Tax=Bagarius yarrelli TaxID=175774 RepID=A0A556V3N9_BAGYA|nr:hypothetical protein Baya_12514 [Bagarius yarrelli]